MAMLCMAEGASVLTETIFENRYMHVPELNRMGAHIETKGRTADRPRRQGHDRRAGDGNRPARLDEPGDRGIGLPRAKRMFSRLYHLDRGYERLEEKLQLVGADVERVGAE